MDFLDFSYRKISIYVDITCKLLFYKGGDADELVEEQEREPEAVEEDDGKLPRAEVQGSKRKSKTRK